jgi:hypothetical protein
VIASKYSPNYFIPEKYKRVLSFKQHLLQSNPLMQIYTFARECKVAENIPGSHFVKAFSALTSYS